MGREKEIRVKLNEKYALSDKEIKRATKEAAKMGKLPELDKVRELKKITDEELARIGERLDVAYPKTNFGRIYIELNELVIGYTGKKPKRIEKQNLMSSYV